MSGDHHHADVNSTPVSRLWASLGLTGGFMLAEVVGGVLTGSLALISDAMHMLTDTAALAIALVAIHVGRRPSDLLRTYGYARFEILAAAFNALLLLAVAFYILYEAWKRLSEPQEIQSGGMLVIAIIGLLVNLASMRLLTSHKDESLNVKGAYLEVWSDMLGSLAVIVGAAVIWFTGWQWVDSCLRSVSASWSSRAPGCSSRSASTFCSKAFRRACGSPMSTRRSRPCPVSPRCMTYTSGQSPRANRR